MSKTHRYIARIIIEAKTGLFVGSGDTSLLKDAIVQRDHLGLPMIQGTSLSGVLRHAMVDDVDFSEFDDEKEEIIRLWGYQFDFDEQKAFNKFYTQKYPSIKESEVPKGFGSRLKISSAYLLNGKYQVAEGLTLDIDENTLSRFENLPARQHVRINERGVAAKQGLFNNEVVYAGTRFLFEIELVGTVNDQSAWQEILNQFNQPTFRLGQGTRNGYGKLAIVSINHRVYDLRIDKDFDDYLNFSPSLNAENNGFEEFNISAENKLTEYMLELTPDSFFIFSEGSGDAEVDNKPVEEEVICYENSGMTFQKKTLIPASSIKGAIAHRTAFYFNKLKARWAETGNALCGNSNEAIKMLFGFEAKDKNGQRGHIIIDDYYLEDSEVNNNKIFNHVAIDRFTGGAFDGALFSEKVSKLIDDSKKLIFSIQVEKVPIEDPQIFEAFEATLKDICKGLLPLGGMTTKGHGIFTGKLFKDKIEIFNYEA